MIEAINELNRFYDFAKGKNFVGAFLEAYGHIFPIIHSNGLTADYRIARGIVKKLRDEVTPAACFVGKHAVAEDEIRFSLDDKAADCELWHKNGRHRKVQITVAQANERRYLMTELNNRGIGRGYLGLTDDQEDRVFRSRINEESRGYSPPEVEKTISRALMLCLSNKKHHSGTDTLLIDGPLELFTADKWEPMRLNFAALATSPDFATNFSEIYFVGSPSSGTCLRLK